MRERDPLLWPGLMLFASLTNIVGNTTALALSFANDENVNLRPSLGTALFTSCCYAAASATKIRHELRERELDRRRALLVPLTETRVLTQVEMLEQQREREQAIEK